MGILDRLKTGLILTKDSILVIRHNPKLMLFPLVSGIAGIFFLILFLGVTFGLAAIDPEGGAMVGFLLVYLVLTFVSTFFTAGLVHQTREVLSGTEPSLKAGIDAAWGRKGPIFVWSLVAATVGVIINGMENSDSRAARIFGTLFGVAWTLMTFFIVPIIVFERVSTTEMFKQSARTFKETFGETPISLVAIQLISGIVLLPFVLIGISVVFVGFVLLGISLILLGILLSFLVTQTLQGVVKTTLYLYATEGKMPDEFDDVDFDDLAKGDSSVGSRTKVTGGGFR